jgi:hypothetical protein
MNAAVALKRRDAAGERHRRRRAAVTKKKRLSGGYLQHRERLTGKGRLRQFVRYLTQVVGFPELADELVRDSRRSPIFRGSTCVLLCILMVVLRYRSFNAFEKRLGESAMRKLFGGRPLPKCVDTLTNALKAMDLDTLEALHQRILKNAARAKALAGPMHRGLRFFAFDGFEPIRSRNRSCPACLTASYDGAGGEQIVDYFHRYVFLYEVGPAPQMLLGLQPLASVAVRQATLPDKVKAEGELTAVKPAIDRLRKCFPKRYDVGIGDALYPNGPMINFLKDGRPAYDLVAVLKKAAEEPMKDAVYLYDRMPPTTQYHDPTRDELVRAWDSEGFRSLSSTEHPLRVARALKVDGTPACLPHVDWDDDNVSSWWMTTTLGKTALDTAELFDAQRRRWDQESAFNDFTQNWFIKHCFIHHETGTTAMMYIFMIAYNLFQLFWHRRLSEKTRNQYTRIAIADEMKIDYGQLHSRAQGFFPEVGT